MDVITEKGITALLLALIGLAIKFIGYLLNVNGDKDKTSISKIELLKSTLQIENSLHVNEYKLLYEELFSLIYKEPLHFHEIKELLLTRSPRMAISKYLKASPYVGIKSTGGFEYKKTNRIRINQFSKRAPIYRGTLVIAYFFLLITSLTVFSTLTNNPETIIPPYGNLFLDSINFFGTVLACAIFIALGIKCLMKALTIPSKSELEEALGSIHDKETVWNLRYIIMLGLIAIGCILYFSLSM